MASARYRRVSPLIWDDEWFVKQDDLTRSIWLLLLTGPQVLPVPGLQLAGPASLAEALRRGSGTVSKPFENLISTGKIFYDPTHRVIRLPNAPKRNLPDNPNQILGWFDVWKSLPESQLKFDHLASLKDAISSVETDRPEAFLKAWDNSFGTVSKPFHNSSDTVSKHRVGSRELELELEWEWLAGTVWATVPQPTEAPQVPPPPPPPPKKARRTSLEGWQPTDAHRSQAQELGVSVDAEAVKFLDYHAAKGDEGKLKDVDAAFRNWLRNAAEYAKRGASLPFDRKRPVVQTGGWEMDEAENERKLKELGIQ